MTEKNFFNRLKTLKVDNNITALDVAKALNITKKSVYTWENIKTIPNADKLLKLADCLNVSLNYFVDRSDDRYYTLNFFVLTLLQDIINLTEKRIKHEQRVQNIIYAWELI